MTELEEPHDHVCVYCGRHAKYVSHTGKYCCSKTYSSCPTNKEHMSVALKKAHVEHKDSYDAIRLSPDFKSWNKGLTKETDERVAKYCNKTHERYVNGELTVWCKGKHLSDDQKKKISDSMKIAHKEGRAHNIGESRWNNEPSYPESWFMKVIENEFDDKNYKREHPFHGFSLDFAWVDKKKCIEIDGDQHQRYDECIERDNRKNTKLIECGWTYLRMPWKDVFNNPKEWIQKAKDFINN